MVQVFNKPRSERNMLNISNIMLKYQELVFVENIPLFILFGYKKNLSLM